MESVGVHRGDGATMGYIEYIHYYYYSVDVIAWKRRRREGGAANGLAIKKKNENK